MNKKDILELKRRLKRESCTFTKVCGAYYDAGRNKITEIDENFLDLGDEEDLKYLKIAKKVLSGILRNNLLETEFREEEKEGQQQYLLGLLDTKLKNREYRENFYNRICEEYDYEGNFLILIFHDIYDVMYKTANEEKLDESEETYEYMICAICPVNLTNGGLGYRPDENRIGARVRDWVVGDPEAGFIYPAFTDRSSDRERILFYTKDTKFPHTEIIEDMLGCEKVMTNAQRKEAFAEAVTDVIGEDRINDWAILNACLDTFELKEDGQTLEKLTQENLKKALRAAGIDEMETELILREAESSVPEDTLIADIIDKRALAAAGEIMRKEKIKSLVDEAARKLENAGEEDLSKKMREAVR